MQSAESFTPLFVIVAYIAGSVALHAYNSGDYSLMSLMNNFMGDFFIVFSLFKFLNLRGFSEVFASYDLIAARFPIYGLIYPFIELGLGVAYLTGFQLFAINWVVVILSLVGSAGVYHALRDGKKLRCACLGAALNLPMTKVTLIENIIMGMMALAMIVG